MLRTSSLAVKRPCRDPLLVRLVDKYSLWHERASSRRQLLELDDRLLKDIGLSRARAEVESAKPFWRP